MIGNPLTEPWTAASLDHWYRDHGVGRRTARLLFQRGGVAKPSDRPGAPERPGTPCLLWTGPTAGTSPDYGRTCYQGKYVGVHRLACLLSGRDLPRGVEAAHLCEVSLCGRPDHIEALTNEAHGARQPRRVYPDSLLALAPSMTCLGCGGPMRPTACRNKLLPYWNFTCNPCWNEYERALRRGRRVPTRRRRAPMSPEALAHGRALGLFTT